MSFERHDPLESLETVTEVLSPDGRTLMRIQGQWAHFSRVDGDQNWQRPPLKLPSGCKQFALANDAKYVACSTRSFSSRLFIFHYSEGDGWQQKCGENGQTFNIPIDRLQWRESGESVLLVQNWLEEIIPHVWDGLRWRRSS